MYIPARTTRARHAAPLRPVSRTTLWTTLTKGRGRMVRAALDWRLSTLAMAPAGLVLLLGTAAAALLIALLVGTPAHVIAGAALLIAGLGTVAASALRAQTPSALPEIQRPTIEHHLVDELQSLRRALRWQHNAVQLASCDSLKELDRCAQAQAASICAPASHAPQGAVGEQVDAPVSPLQQAGLTLLSTIVELRSSALQTSIAQQRTQDALTALWQIAGLSQIAMRPGVELLRPPCEQIARALQLDWIVLMAPDAACPVTPVLTAYGASIEAIALHPAYLRVAAEALRSERTLVRDEGQHGYLCMPILRRERAPLVIAARGAAVGGTTQTILQLLGDLLARCLDVPAAGAGEMRP